MKPLFSLGRVALIALLASLAAGASFAEDDVGVSEKPEAEISDVFQAPVIVDGEELFQLRGSTALPADERAEAVSRRIIEIAEASDARDITLGVRQGEFGPAVFFGRSLITIVTEADAELEQMDVLVLADLQKVAIEQAIETYRQERTDEARIDSALEVLGWTVGFGLLTCAFLFIRNRLPNWIADKVVQGTMQVESATRSIIRVRTIGSIVRQLMVFLLFAIFFLSFYYYLSFVLFAFAETRPIAQFLLRNITDPVLAIGTGFVDFLPNLVTLLLIAFITRFLLRIVSSVFEAIENGTFDIENFEQHWILPTHNILRVGIFLVAVVFAYPYVPGADSAAFKGLTILVGIMVSLGSSSVVGNILSGLFVIYRRSTNVGDRIKVGDKTGDVIEIKLMETHIKSIKNELVSIPNALLLNSEVINYSRKIDGRGLVVFTTVGIGYEEPPVKVEAMLIEAARRTAGLKAKPAPFVLWEALADYAINYQINAYTSRRTSIPLLKSNLHQNIVAVFAENEVQIMTPSYVADPPEPKIPLDPWDGVLARSTGAGSS